jgi:phosphate transport system substrate-binding protein
LTQDNVQNRTYPLIRDAYIYLNRDPNRPLDPKVREFVRYILSREGQAALLPLGFYYPLTMEMVEKEQKKLE